MRIIFKVLFSVCLVLAAFPAVVLMLVEPSFSNVWYWEGTGIETVGLVLSYLAVKLVGVVLLVLITFILLSLWMGRGKAARILFPQNS